MPDVEKRTDSQTTMPKVFVGLIVTALAVAFAGFIFVNARRLGWTLGWIYTGMVAAALAINLACLLRWNPELIRRRMRFGQFTKAWDMVWAVLFYDRCNRNLRCRGSGDTRRGRARAGSRMVAGPCPLHPRMDTYHLVHGRKSVLRKNSAHPDGPRTSRDRHGTLRLHPPPRLRRLRVGLDPPDAAPACVDQGLYPGPNCGRLARDPHGA